MSESAASPSPTPRTPTLLARGAAGASPLVKRKNTEIFVDKNSAPVASKILMKDFPQKLEDVSTSNFLPWIYEVRGFKEALEGCTLHHFPVASAHAFLLLVKKGETIKSVVKVADLAAVETHLSRPLLKDVADTVVETAAHRGLIDQVGEDLMQMIEDTVEDVNKPVMLEYLCNSIAHKRSLDIDPIVWPAESESSDDDSNSGSARARGKSSCVLAPLAGVIIDTGDQAFLMTLCEAAQDDAIALPKLLGRDEKVLYRQGTFIALQSVLSLLAVQPLAHLDFKAANVFVTTSEEPRDFEVNLAALWELLSRVFPDSRDFRDKPPPQAHGESVRISGCRVRAMLSDFGWSAVPTTSEELAYISRNYLHLIAPPRFQWRRKLLMFEYDDERLEKMVAAAQEMNNPPMSDPAAMKSWVADQQKLWRVQGALFCGAYTEAPKLWEEHLKQTLGIFLWGTWRLMREQWRLPDEGERLLDAFLGWWPALREHAAKHEINYKAKASTANFGDSHRELCASWVSPPSDSGLLPMPLMDTSSASSLAKLMCDLVSFSVEVSRE